MAENEYVVIDWRPGDLPTAAGTFGSEDRATSWARKRFEVDTDDSELPDGILVAQLQSPGLWPEAEEEKFFIVRLWDGFDGEWIDVSEPLPRAEAEKIRGDKNESRRGPGTGKREGNFGDIDYYAVFPADTKMRFADGNSQTRGRQ